MEETAGLPSQARNSGTGLSLVGQMITLCCCRLNYAGVNRVNKILIDKSHFFFATFLFVGNLAAGFAVKLPTTVESSVSFRRVYRPD